MPVLFIILGQRLGLDVTLARAPLHVFVKYTDKMTGVTVNLETTSGANPARDAWYRQQMPMSDTALANGLYLRKLTTQEMIVVMAEVTTDKYFREQDFAKVIVLADIALKHYPQSETAMLMKGSAYYKLLEKHFFKKYPIPDQIPVGERAFYHYLSDNNRYWFTQAEILGWRAPSQTDETNYINTIKRDAQRRHH